MNEKTLDFSLVRRERIEKMAYKLKQAKRDDDYAAIRRWEKEIEIQLMYIQHELSNWQPIGYAQ